MSSRPEVEVRPARILIVDDERHNRELLEVVLTPEGFQLLTAASGEEALAIVAEHAPDLILLDVMMPGMSGYQVAAKIKSRLASRNTPVIMVTALDDHDARMRGLNAGAEEFLTKPVDRSELCARVRNLLRLKAHGDYYDHYSQVLEGRERDREEQMRVQDEFLSHISHELRSPLTAIKQFTTILLGGLAGDLNVEQRQYQQIVLKNVEQLQAMIDDLLEVTRLETGKLSVESERVSVADAVIDTFHTLQVTAQARGITLTSDVPADLPWARGDATRLRQVLIILLDNAIKFSCELGVITIQARQIPDEPQFLQIDVSDNGCGISPEAADRVFERLYQPTRSEPTSREGLGLGLYICKELVTRQGGRIDVKSQLQKGSTFSFTLPVFAPNTSTVHPEKAVNRQHVLGVCP